MKALSNFILDSEFRRKKQEIAVQQKCLKASSSAPHKLYSEDTEFVYRIGNRKCFSSLVQEQSKNTQASGPQIEQINCCIWQRFAHSDIVISGVCGICRH